MDNKKLRRVLAIVALVFMAIFTVTLVITFYDPKLYHGAFSYAALISGLLGIGLFLIVRFLLKEKEKPDYLPEDLPEDIPEEQTESEAVTDESESEQTAQDEEGDAQT